MPDWLVDALALRERAGLMLELVVQISPTIGQTYLLVLTLFDDNMASKPASLAIRPEADQRLLPSQRRRQSP